MVVDSKPKEASMQPRTGLGGAGPEGDPSLVKGIWRARPRGCRKRVLGAMGGEGSSRVTRKGF